MPEFTWENVKRGMDKGAEEGMKPDTGVVSPGQLEGLKALFGDEGLHGVEDDDGLFRWRRLYQPIVVKGEDRRVLKTIEDAMHKAQADLGDRLSMDLFGSPLPRYVWWYRPVLRWLHRVEHPFHKVIWWLEDLARNLETWLEKKARKGKHERS